MLSDQHSQPIDIAVERLVRRESIPSLLAGADLDIQQGLIHAGLKRLRAAGILYLRERGDTLGAEMMAAHALIDEDGDGEGSR